MFWWFERHGELMRYEARSLEGDAFELVIVHADGNEQIERFAESAELTERQRGLERELLKAGWSGPHGWNL